MIYSAVTSRFPTRHTRHAGLLMCVILLSACGSFEVQDSAPARDIDHTRVQNAVPRDEPLSKYGNPASYVVGGNRYHVMSTALGYEEEGVASWYGTKFHGRRTSSGEMYNMYAMTAAHKTLPIPSYVEVTNLDNNRSIIVRVNDRGPFVDDRIIDLSYVAAKKLDITTYGTGRVHLRANDPRAPQNSPPQEVTTRVALASPVVQPAADNPAAANKPKVTILPVANAAVVGGVDTTPEVAPVHGQLYLQVGAFAEHSNAAQLMLKLVTETTENVTINRQASGESDIYRVRIGPLASQTDAERLRAQLGKLGIPSPHIVVE